MTPKEIIELFAMQMRESFKDLDRELGEDDLEDTHHILENVLADAYLDLNDE